MQILLRMLDLLPLPQRVVEGVLRIGKHRQHGGTLTCRPNSERGTTFRLELPARAAHVTLKKTKAAAL